MNAPITEIPTDRGKTNEEFLQVSLIEEPLDSESTCVPVLQLLKALGQYHRLRDFSHRERFGAPDPQSTQALAELRQARQSLQALASTAEGNAGHMLIEASLNLKMTPRLS